MVSPINLQMMRKWIRAAAPAAGGVLIPALTKAQGLSGETGSLHLVLGQLYEEMVPLCSGLIGVGQGIAGFAALWYIGARVWRHLANAEPVDFYPLLRPFVLGLAIVLFPSVLDLMNGVLAPTVRATSGMVSGSHQAIAVLQRQKEEALRQTDAWQVYVGETGDGDRDRWYKYTHDETSPEGEGLLEGIGNDIRFAMAKASYSFRSTVRGWLHEVLRLLYEAAALCIDTIRTFQLVVLAILGPLVFGLSVFDGFHHTLTVWAARYINVYLWLPVANIFGAIMAKVQELMLSLDISQVEETGNTFFSPTDAAYLVFLVMGTVGYLTVPSVANYIVHASGGNALLYKVSNLFHAGSRTAVQAASGGVGMAAGAVGGAAVYMTGSLGNGSGSQGAPSTGAGAEDSTSYLRDRLAGKE